MKKYIMDLDVLECTSVNEKSLFIRLTCKDRLPQILPGQFVQVGVDSKDVFLRRPISVHYVDYDANELWLLVQMVGNGTRAMAHMKKFNVVLPLGNGFTVTGQEKNPLLVGGGVGVAPLLYLGRVLKEKGADPVFLLGARSKADLLRVDAFEKFGRVYVTTEDGSLGEKGFVTGHSILENPKFDMVYSCGPQPMMKAVAGFAVTKGLPLEVSLENRMACGLGACLCCVEDTKEGHRCVCTDGPVFNIDELKW